MNTEQKAKAYDEAIDKVAHFIRKHVGFGCMIHPNSSESKELFNIFPELKESKEEQSKKWILEYLYDGLRKSDEQFKSQFKAAIDWLKKQGEQGTLCDKCRKEHPSGSCQDITALGRCALEHEQKSIDKVEAKFKVKYAGSEYNVFETKDIAGVTYYGIEDEPNHIDYVKAENCEIIGGYSIKEGGFPFPTKPIMFSEHNSAWDEEDEKRIKKVMHILSLDGRISNKELKSILDWLKSLEPQNKWKPTEEQMNALDSTLQYIQVSHNSVEHLNSLFNDLKKLREE